MIGTLFSVSAFVKDPLSGIGRCASAVAEQLCLGAGGLQSELRRTASKESWAHLGLRCLRVWGFGFRHVWAFSSLSCGKLEILRDSGYGALGFWMCSLQQKLPGPVTTIISTIADGRHAHHAPEFQRFLHSRIFTRYKLSTHHHQGLSRRVWEQSGVLVGSMSVARDGCK